MNISSREREIIKFLLENETEITVKAIADQLEVSTRTVHRDLKSIENVLSSFRLKLVKKTGVGLQLIGDDADKERLRQAISNVTVFDFSPEERRTVILATLLELNAPLKLFTLATELKVTEATISHDLDQMEPEIAKFHLSLIRKRGYGVEIKGKEADKRAALSHLIATYFDPFEFVNLIKMNIEMESESQLNTISKRLLDFINPEKLIIIEKVVKDASSALPYELADSAHIGLVVHLALAMERLQKGESIKFDQTFLQQIEQTTEYEIAKRMIRRLEEELKQDIPDDEIGYITMHLMGAKIRIDDQGYVIEESSIDIAFQVRALIQEVSTQLGVDLTSDSRLLHDLVAHLKPASYRLQQNMQIVNPLLQNIKDDYQELFSLIQHAVREIFPGLDFPDDEIGYLVLHFASTLLNGKRELNLRALVICSSGIGSAKMLATKLMQKVPEVKHVDNQSFFDLQRLNLDRYDLIVSTIPLKGFEREYIQASPMLTNNEVHRIRKMVNQKKLRFDTDRKLVGKSTDGDFVSGLEALTDYSRAILDLLQSIHVEPINDKATMESILLQACTRLEHEQRVTNKDKIVKKLQEREKLSGLGIPGTSIALYHTRSMDVKSPSLSVYPLANPLAISGMDGEKMTADTVLLMLAPVEARQEVLEVFSLVSSLLITDEKSVGLFTTGDKEELKQYLSEQFRKFLLEKNLL